VRVRLALGLKNVKHNVAFMANDDVATPSAMVGKKIAPIYQQAELTMPESMDIINMIDTDPKFGPPGLFRPATDRADIKAWEKKHQSLMRELQRPRYVKAVGFPEFAQKDGRTAFIKNHQLPPYEKAEWKDDANVPQAKREEMYEAALAKSAALLPKFNEALAELEDIIHCPECATEGGLSIDDITLWSRLRSITLVKGAKYGPKLKAYLDHFAEIGDVPLYYNMAI
jgi:glutaredoxin 2